MAAVLSRLAGVPPFEFNKTGLATKWLSWKASFGIYVRSVHYSFTRVVGKYKNGSNPTRYVTGDENECQVCPDIEQIRTNVPKERHNFLSMSPEGGETINTLIIRLKKTVEYCEHGVKKKPRSEIVFCTSSDIKC